MSEVKKKPKRHIRRSLLALIIVIIAAVVLAIRVPKQQQKVHLKDLGYSEETIEKILENEYYDVINENGYYSTALANAIDDNSLHIQYIDFYANRANDEKVNEKDLLLYARLQDIGYDNVQLNNLFNRLEFWEITPLLIFEFQWNEDQYIEDCIANRETNSPDSFTLDGNYRTLYRLTSPAEKIDSPYVLVNKTYYLPEDFEPKDLEEISDRYAVYGQEVCKEVKENIEEFCEASIENETPFYISNAYWSYEDIEVLYNNNLLYMSEEEADYLVNRPGFSEHQTGLAINVSPTYESEDDFTNTYCYEYLSENCTSYGFIERYPENKSIITGVYSEPTHLRYLGKDLAEKVKASGLTYDEYYCLFLKTWLDEEFKPSQDILDKIANYSD